MLHARVQSAPAAPLASGLWTDPKAIPVPENEPWPWLRLPATWNRVVVFNVRTAPVGWTSISQFPEPDFPVQAPASEARSGRGGLEALLAALVKTPQAWPTVLPPSTMTTSWLGVPGRR